MIMICNQHKLFPDIESCIDCKENYEKVLRRWYGEKAVENFRLHYQREVILPALRVSNTKNL